MRGAARLFTSLLLIMSLAILAIPAVVHLGPGFVAALTAGTDGPPTRNSAQLPPSSLSTIDSVAVPKPSAVLPDKAVLAADLDAALTAPAAGRFTGIVTDALTGAVLYDRGADTAAVPASNLKLLTAVAALESMGAYKQFSTRVVRGDDSHELVLVGGGDVLLGSGRSAPGRTMGHAGLASLAERTASALAAAGTTGRLRVSVDDSLFSGPVLNPHWQSGDVRNGEIAPIFPMALNAARYEAGSSSGSRPQASALLVGGAFAKALAAAAPRAGLHITVEPGVARSTAPERADELAVVQSAPVAALVGYMLSTSDNYVAEVLGRLAAAATGQPASFAGATQTVGAIIGRLGVPTRPLQLADACGLSMRNRVSARALAAALSLLVTGGDADLRQGAAGLPIAGLTGTLKHRYRAGGALGGAGLVRAKTGTLNTVQSLSGTVVDADGRLLLFSFIGNRFSGGSQAAKAPLDAAASVLAGCGCRAPQLPAPTAPTTAGPGGRAAGRAAGRG